VLITVGVFIAVLLLIGVIGNVVNPAPVAAGTATPAPTVTVTATVTATVQATSSAAPAPAATVTVTAKAEPAATVTVTVTAKAKAPDVPKAPAEPAVSDGDYLVGSDIAPGTYKTTGNAEDQDGIGMCYADTETKSGGINAQEVTNKGRTLIRVKTSDYTFSSSGCGDWKKVG